MRVNGKKRLKNRDLMQLFAEQGDFSNKKGPKRDPKSGLGLLRDPGLPKRDPVDSSVKGPLGLTGRTEAKLRMTARLKVPSGQLSG